MTAKEGFTKSGLPLLYSVYNPETDRSKLTRALKYKDHYVPRNFDTDFTTTKWFIRWLVPRFGKGNIGAVLHDFYYTVRTISRKEADKLYRETCIDCGVNKINAYLRYFGLRLIGSFWFNDEKSAKAARIKYKVRYEGVKHGR